MLEDGSYSIKSTPFQKLKGLFIPAFEPVYFPNNQVIIFGSKQGLIIYDSGFKENILTQHNCFINEVSLPLKDSLLFRGGNDLMYNYDNEIQTSENELLHFTFSSSFIEPLSLTFYSTYLEGYDSVWQDWISDNEREFLNLPDGKYTFWVKSKNIYEVESPTASFTFQINRKDSIFSQSFLILILFALILASIFYYYFEKKKKTKLSKNVSDLESTLASKNKKLNILGNKKTEWKKEKEKINQKLSNVLLKNEVYDGLINKIKGLKDNDIDKKDLEKLIGNFQSNLKEVDLQLNAQKSLETDDFLTKIKTTYPELSARELRLCSYLKLNISSKELANYLGISIRGVESLRYRVRKKMGLSKEQDLTEFIFCLLYTSPSPRDRG